MKKIALLLAALTLLGTLAGCSSAPQPQTAPPAVEATPEPEPEKEYQYISAEDLKVMIEDGEERFIVDIQPQEYYELGHLPKSIATYAYPADTDELKGMLGDSLSQINGSDAPVIVVGLGGKTGAKNAVDHYVESGVDASRLHILEGGMMSWPYDELSYATIEYQYITPEEVMENLDDGINMMIVDVRVKEEYDEGHLPGAILTDSFPNRDKAAWDKLSELTEKIDETIDPIVIVCPSGGPGAMNAIDHYVANGLDHRKFYILSGGGKAWPEKDVLEVTPELQYIAPETLKKAIDAEDDMIILSVQSKSNYREVGHLPNSIETDAYPADTPALREELEDVADELKDSSLPIYVMCHEGKEGAVNAITYYVNNENISAKRFYIIEGGIEAWPYPEMLETGR